jgi:hypothetical protein
MEATVMQQEPPPDKIVAIYDLRAAVETKVRAEVAADISPTPSARDALLNATLEVESKTQDAIDACLHCGRPHTDDDPPCAGPDEPPDNVVPIDFGGPRRPAAG